jgi:hypothetical protein
MWQKLKGVKVKFLSKLLTNNSQQKVLFRYKPDQKYFFHHCITPKHSIQNHYQTTKVATYFMKTSNEVIKLVGSIKLMNENDNIFGLSSNNNTNLISFLTSSGPSAVHDLKRLGLH